MQAGPYHTLLLSLRLNQNNQRRSFFQRQNGNGDQAKKQPNPRVGFLPASPQNAVSTGGYLYSATPGREAGESNKARKKESKKKKEEERRKKKGEKMREQERKRETKKSKEERRK